MEGPRLIDNIKTTLRDDLMQIIRPGSRVSIAAASFSIYAFQEINEQLKDIDEHRFIFTSPYHINGDNRKIIIFTAFSDTAQYLYDNIAPIVKETIGLNTALVSGNVEARSTLRLREKLDFNKVLTLFSPISKEKSSLYPNLNETIDILIATDCISEGQNLQDCDYLINYDIHWNPVRIIQRFGRIDRLGSRNAAIQLVNYWPDLDLDDYINLKGRVEARMKVSVLTATGDDNPLSAEEQGDLKYRRDQLERLKEEVVDIEEMNTGVSIMDLGLNEFRLDLLYYMNAAQGKDHSSIGPELRHCESSLSQDDSTIGADTEMKRRTKDWQDIEHTPMGLHALVPADKDSPPGVIFVLEASGSRARSPHMRGPERCPAGQGTARRLGA